MNTQPRFQMVYVNRYDKKSEPVFVPMHFTFVALDVFNEKIKRSQFDVALYKDGERIETNNHQKFPKYLDNNTTLNL